MQRGRYRWVLNRGRSLRGHVEQPPDLVASSQLGLTMITEPVPIHPDRSGAGLRVELPRCRHLSSLLAGSEPPPDPGRSIPPRLPAQHPVRHEHQMGISTRRRAPARAGRQRTIALAMGAVHGQEEAARDRQRRGRTRTRRLVLVADSHGRLTPETAGRPGRCHDDYME